MIEALLNRLYKCATLGNKCPLNEERCPDLSEHLSDLYPLNYPY